MIEQKSFKVDGKPKTIDTVIDTDATNPRNTISEGADPDVNETIFEPKIKNRFLVKLLDQHQNEIIPSYLIKEIQRPEIYMDEFASYPQYSSMSISIYDPVAINLAKILNTEVGKKLNINLQILGPTSDTIETWYFENVVLTTLQYSNCNWSNDDLSYITAHFNTNHTKITIS